MKRFEFHLDGLLRVKRQLEQVAEVEQHRAERAVSDAAAVLDRLRGELARAADALADRVGQPVLASRWATAYGLIETVGRQIADAEANLLLADRRLATARQERVQVATEVEAIATLRQQRWDQWRQEAAKADQERIDELGLRRWKPAQAGAA